MQSLLLSGSLLTRFAAGLSPSDKMPASCGQP